MKYMYRVEATRRVRRPECGPEAFETSTKRVEIPFGKDEAIKTGKEALAVATEKAQELMDKSSEVSVWRLTVAGNGTGKYLKEDRKTLFEDGWEAVGA